MAFATVPIVYQMTMSFEAEGQGWQEKLYSSLTSRAGAMTRFNDLLNFRRNCLNADAVVLYAKGCRVGVPRDGAKCDGNYPLPGLWGNVDSTVAADVAAAHIDAPNTAIGIRFEETENNWATRWMHGIPDPEVNSYVLQTPVATQSSLTSLVPWATASTLTSWAARVEAYLSQVFTYTSMFRKRTVDANTVMQLSPIDKILCNGATSHKTGRPFGIAAGHAPIR